MNALPVVAILDELKKALRQQTGAVLVAPPGAGKTTRVPPALLGEPWLGGKRIVMLEPRRLAVRTVARYMAAQLGEKVGQTVGYRVRMEHCVGPQTRIEVITEGILTRMLQHDPELGGIGAVIFDEYHERSLQADLALALCLDARAVLRPDLRILVMSATLEAEPVAALLAGAPVIRSEGRAFPVETHYADSPAVQVETVMVQTILRALASHPGDVLAFLPGVGEIRRVRTRLEEAALPAEVSLAPLYGNLPSAAQDAAIAPSSAGRRKVVLATSLAETSLTVEGVRVVVDSGLARVPRFSPRTGLTRLETVTVSRSSADQRRGRAGRVAAGVCYRLWTRREDAGLEARTLPEILAADLAPLLLELAAWGESDPGRLRWLDQPPVAALAQARELLAGLHALDNQGRITAHGRQLVEAGLHPRLAHMIVTAMPLGCGSLACDLAALLGERDIYRNIAEPDLRLRLEGLAAFRRGRTPADCDQATCLRVSKESEELRRQFGIAGPAADPEAAGLVLAFAYPDRIAMRRSDGRYLLRNGRGAAFAGGRQSLPGDFVVAAELDDRGADSSILLATPLDGGQLYRHFAEEIVSETTVNWDRAARAVRARLRSILGQLVLEEGPLKDPDPGAVLAALLAGIETEGLTILPWTKAARQMRDRLAFMHNFQADWPDVSDAALIATLSVWLGPHLYGLRSADDLSRLNLTDILIELLTWQQRRRLDEAAPTHSVVPSGQRIPIDYSAPEAPALAVRLQELFGLTETPRIADGRVALTLHLLSPAHRPVQVTRDLASFWRNAYFEVRKDLLGRYPKHYWPEDPLAATPTHRAKPRK